MRIYTKQRIESRLTAGHKGSHTNGENAIMSLAALSNSYQVISVFQNTRRSTPQAPIWIVTAWTVLLSCKAVQARYGADGALPGRLFCCHSQQYGCQYEPGARLRLAAFFPDDE
ncbi:MAG: hypothetical protein K2O91_12805 [Lachnospiraceae bacterium]|nr:hypothetical protein [Lachnospiraceae bacterium]